MWGLLCSLTLVWKIMKNFCKHVTLSLYVTGTLFTFLGFKLHREYTGFPFCSILGQTKKVSCQGVAMPLGVARNQLFSHREYIRFQLYYQNPGRFQSYIVITLLLSVHKCSWTVNHSFPNGKNDLITPPLSQSFQMVMIHLHWLCSVVL